MQRFKNGICYKTFTKDGVKFFFFKDGNQKVLCTGQPTGTTTLSDITDMADIYELDGATSVVSGSESLTNLYTKWLKITAFQREFGILF